jgi:hypothetical protein
VVVLAPLLLRVTVGRESLFLIDGAASDVARAPFTPSPFPPASSMTAWLRLRLCVVGENGEGGGRGMAAARSEDAEGDNGDEDGGGASCLATMCGGMYKSGRGEGKRRWVRAMAIAGVSRARGDEGTVVGVVAVDGDGRAAGGRNRGDEEGVLRWCIESGDHGADEEGERVGERGGDRLCHSAVVVGAGAGRT